MIPIVQPEYQEQTPYGSHRHLSFYNGSWYRTFEKVGSMGKGSRKIAQL